MAIIEDLLRVIDMLMPGIRFIAVQDYALLNDAQIRAKQWLKENDGAGDTDVE